MKTWTKFIFIPLVYYFLSNSILFLSGDVLSPNASLIYVLLTLVMVMILNAITPYLMLRLAPKAPYISMLCYMSILLGLIYSVKIYTSNQGVEINSMKIGVIAFSITLAVVFYFFFNDFRFKVTYGKARHLKTF
jgi:hypothetical protein